jgi:hypothetical protein
MKVRHIINALLADMYFKDCKFFSCKNFVCMSSINTSLQTLKYLEVHYFLWTI